MLEPSQPIDAALLRAFVTVAETRSFTRAAERLNCVQSAVSMQIKRLEEALQVRVLNRTSREVRLTREGEIVLRYAHRVMRLTADAMTELGQRVEPGRVRLAATDMSMCFLPPVLTEFGKRFPLVQVELSCNRSREALELLEAGDADLAFVTQRCGRSGGQQIMHRPLVWAAARHSDAPEVDPLPLAIFAPDCIYRKAAVQALDDHGMPFRFAYESTSRAGLDCVVEAGLAVTVLPIDGVSGRLRVLDSGFPSLPDLKTYLFHANGSRVSPSVDALADLLLEMLAVPAPQRAE